MKTAVVMIIGGGQSGRPGRFVFSLSQGRIYLSHFLHINIIIIIIIITYRYHDYDLMMMWFLCWLLCWTWSWLMMIELILSLPTAYNYDHYDHFFPFLWNEMSIINLIPNLMQETLFRKICIFVQSSSSRPPSSPRRPDGFDNTQVEAKFSSISQRCIRAPKPNFEISSPSTTLISAVAAQTIKSWSLDRDILFRASMSWIYCQAGLNSFLPVWFFFSISKQF